MKRAEKGVVRRKVAVARRSRAEGVKLALNDSLGYQVRVTHRSIQRLLEATIAPYGVKLGMWYFLRVLWEEDGLTQSELSRRIGTMEPTTLHAIAGMEECGLVSRTRNSADRRKMNVFLTKKGR
ncbi:MAG: MarR family transcriptional regulator, partial [Gemmatimonadaceae bacterium]